MYKSFATVNMDKTATPINVSDIHSVNVTFPPDQMSSDLLENVSFYKSFIHDFRIETSDKTSSLNDMFTSMVPIGSNVQHITVRYLELPERATVGLEHLPDFVESVHIISSVISEHDIQRVKSMSTDLSVRLTGLLKEQTNIDSLPYMKVGKDHIVFSKKIVDTNEDIETTLNENDALQYIFDNRSISNF